jgi:acyl dehydratase
MTTTIEGTSGLAARVGEHLGYSSWHQVTEQQVQLFAQATGDQVVPEVVDWENKGPFRGPTAHGYLTLSLVPTLLASVFEVRGVSLWINYGLNRLRFPAPVPVGTRIRCGAQISSAEEVDGGIQVDLAIVIEVEGGAKPACVADILFRYYR